MSAEALAEPAQTLQAIRDAGWLAVARWRAEPPRLVRSVEAKFHVCAALITLGLELAVPPKKKLAKIRRLQALDPEL